MQTKYYKLRKVATKTQKNQAVRLIKLLTDMDFDN